MRNIQLVCLQIFLSIKKCGTLTCIQLCQHVVAMADDTTTITPTTADTIAHTANTAC